jgi:GT2 family glycosyltransferase
MKVSVIIPVWNDTSRLREALAAVFSSSYPLHEVIVVDDGSDVPVGDAIADFDCKLVRLSPNRGVGPARNAGAASASGDVLFYTDSDVVIAADTIAIGVEALLERPDAAAVVGTYAAHGGPDTFASRLKNLVYHHVHITSDLERFGHFIGNCGLIRASELQAVGGFDAQGPWARCLEDVELGLRLVRSGRRIALCPAMQVVHQREFDVLSLLRSDLFKRAIPWTGLLLRYRGAKLDNCTSTAASLCVLLMFVLAATPLVAVLISAQIALMSGLLGAVGIVLLELPLLHFISSEAGRAFALKAVGMRFLFHGCCALGLIIGLGRYGSLNKERRQNVSATAQPVVLETK